MGAAGYYAKRVKGGKNSNLLAEVHTRLCDCRQSYNNGSLVAVADHVISQLKVHGDPWHLTEEAQSRSGPTT